MKVVPQQYGLMCIESMTMIKVSSAPQSQGLSVSYKRSENRKAGLFFQLIFDLGLNRGLK